MGRSDDHSVDLLQSVRHSTAFQVDSCLDELGRVRLLNEVVSLLLLLRLHFIFNSQN